MLVSLIRALLEGSYSSWALLPAMLHSDTDLELLGGYLKENGVRREYLAAVIVWIMINRPEEIGKFIKTYKSVAKIYDCFYIIPKKVMEQYGIKEKVDSTLIPDKGLCQTDRAVLVLPDRNIYRKTGFKNVVVGDDWYDEETGELTPSWSHTFETKESAEEAFKKALDGKEFDVAFISDGDWTVAGDEPSRKKFPKQYKMEDTVVTQASFYISGYNHHYFDIVKTDEKDKYDLYIFKWERDNTSHNWQNPTWVEKLSDVKKVATFKAGYLSTAKTYTQVIANIKKRCKTEEVK